MFYIKGGVSVNKAQTKSIFYYFKYSLFLWIIGIFLYTNNVFASTITPQKLIDLTNQERTKYELNVLTENVTLAKAAEKKANDILTQQKFSHNFKDRKFSQWVKDAGYQYSIVGENLAINFISSEGLFNAWLASPTHKQNILHEDYQEIGTAVVPGNFADENTIIVVELFASPAVAAEQILAGSSTDRELKIPLLASSYYNASNLSENYITNIVSQDVAGAYTSLEPIELSSFSIDKNRITNYFTWLFQFIIFSLAVMFLVILVHSYITYFPNLIKKLGETPYSTIKRRKENYVFTHKFMVKNYP